MPAASAETFHPRVLAHVGDSVFEIWVRDMGARAQPQATAVQMHRFTTQRVSASAQVALMAALADWLETWLTPDETDLMRRARNLTLTTQRRQQQQKHRQATALEALLGWWHFYAPQRLAAFYAQAQPYVLAGPAEAATAADGNTPRQRKNDRPGGHSPVF